MKKYYFPNLVLLIEGQLFGFLIYFFVLFSIYQLLFNFEESGFAGVLLFFFSILALVFNQYYFAPHCFAIIKVNDESITSFGLFLPIVKLKVDKTKYVDVRTFKEKNVFYSKSVDAYKFIILSENPIPNTRVDKIHTSRKNKIIKVAVSEKLCAGLLEVLPKNCSKAIDYQLFLYKKSK